jgi:hypothetical protein
VKLVVYFEIDEEELEEVLESCSGYYDYEVMHEES